MKNKYILFAILILIVVVGIIIGVVMMHAQTPYSASVPRDAQAVVLLDMPALSKEPVVHNLLAEKMQSWEELGIGVDKPFYGFVTSDGYFGALCEIPDLDRFVDVVSSKGLVVEKQRGLRWTQYDGWQLCIGSDRCMIIGPGATTDPDMRNRMVEWMRQKESSQSMTDSLLLSEGALRGILSIDLLPSYSTKLIAQALDMTSPLSEAKLQMNLSLQDNSLTLSTKLRTENAHLLESISSLEDTFQPIQGNLLCQGPKEPMLWACFHTQGEKLLNVLRRYPSIRTALIALNFCADVDQMIHSIDGDVSLAIDPQKEERYPALITAEVKQTDVLKVPLQWHDDDMGLYFGVCNGKFYASTDETMAMQATIQNPSELLSNLHFQDESTRLYVTLDAHLFSQQVLPFCPAFIAPLVQHISRVELCVGDSLDSSLNISFDTSLSEIISPLLTK